MKKLDSRILEVELMYDQWTEKYLIAFYDKNGERTTVNVTLDDLQYASERLGLNIME